ncbi:MAG: sigma-70 family RNA polymerase sigma factor [Anaerolineales bacterium]|nr:sigma-70 family RNA polymerase sigma factor [Anaerolineales bacterium]
MANSGITLSELEAICRQTAPKQTTDTGGFRPTAKQIYFFSLVWLLKRKVTIGQATDCLEGEVAARGRDHPYQVANHLCEWGATATLLKQGDAIEWELLRLQQEKAIRYYGCSAEMKAEAVQQALLKTWKLLKKMADGSKIEQTQELVALILANRTIWTNIYDFSTPFYAFTKRIARNELVTELRKQSAEPLYPDSWDEIDAIVPSIPPPSLPVDEPTVDLRPLQLKIDLAKLLELIQRQLTPKPRQVIMYTLAAQPQFWLALKIADLSPSAGFPVRAEFASDVELGQALGMNENAVRVHRANAKKLIQAHDPLLSLLVEALLTRRGGAHSQY